MECNVQHETVKVMGRVITPATIPNPALREIISALAQGDHATLVSCRHKDWSQQAQCGCVMGCVGG